MPVFKLSKDIFFPPPELAREDGLLAVGGDLSPNRLLLAYQMGIFPWYSEGDPLLWWSPIPRLLLPPKEFILHKRLARQLRKESFTFSMDRAFEQVIRQCAESRLQSGEETWINEDMIEAYCLLHQHGYAHSLECWQDDTLVGGLYGLAIGAAFFGESMFAKVSNSSKASLAVLCIFLEKLKFEFIDCQMRTEHLISMGAREFNGPHFFDWLQLAILKSRPPGSWSAKVSGNTQETFSWKDLLDS